MRFPYWIAAPEFKTVKAVNKFLILLFLLGSLIKKLYSKYY